jgi:hypothetical protein
MHTNSPKKLIEHLKTTKLDLSFDENTSIEWAQHNRCKDLIRLLLNDERVISKLTQEERNEYIEIILGFR